MLDRPVEPEEERPNRWTLMHRRDWPVRVAYALVRPGDDPPEPDPGDEDLEVFDVVRAADLARLEEENRRLREAVNASMAPVSMLIDWIEGRGPRIAEHGTSSRDARFAIDKIRVALSPAPEDTPEAKP